MIKTALLSCFILISVTACETTNIQQAQDAVLAAPTADSLSEISKAVSKALGGRRTLLANDILTTAPTLIIDPKYVDDRSRQRPDHFRLQLAGSKCILLHEQSGEIYPLQHISCTPF